ncbi:AI-2E family transporter [Butyricicoccus sp. 1XD8-22]|nr:AI-2E family transporter [Butyricicoccus sp. 1XD8-22]RKJ82413.1 AI-2E family transporter [Butyricicoccus sp. 1XD8-22]
MEKKKRNTILALTVFGVLFYTVVQRVEFGALFGILKPFLLGAGIAFVLNVPMRAIERALAQLCRTKGKTPRRKQKGLLRVASILLTFALFVGVVLLVCLMILPEIARSARTLGGYLSDFYEMLVPYINELAAFSPDLASLSKTWESINWAETVRQVFGFLWNFLWSGGLIDNTFGAAATLVSALANAFIGLIFAIYLLVMKETLARQLKRLGYAYLPEEQMDGVVTVCRMANDTFSHFLSGQCVEAVLLGVMFFIVMTFGSFPYALMISTLIAVTALIPLFGAFIGCAVGTFLILIVSPLKAAWFIVIFLVLQQIEGNLIYPRVVGSSVGLPSIWVLAAVTIGAGTMGVAGMFLAIPAFSVVYQVLRGDSLRRVKEKGVPTKKYQ